MQNYIVGPKKEPLNLGTTLRESLGNPERSTKYTGSGSWRMKIFQIDHIILEANKRECNRRIRYGKTTMPPASALQRGSGSTLQHPGRQMGFIAETALLQAPLSGFQVRLRRFCPLEVKVVVNRHPVKHISR